MIDNQNGESSFMSNPKAPRVWVREEKEVSTNFSSLFVVSWLFAHNSWNDIKNLLEQFPVSFTVNLYMA